MFRHPLSLGSRYILSSVKLGDARRRGVNGIASLSMAWTEFSQWLTPKRTNPYLAELTTDHSPAMTEYTDLVKSLENSFIVPPDQSMWHIAHLQNFLSWIHDSGLPWWGSIVALTFIFRTLVLPLNISLVKNSARLNAIRPELENLRYQFENEKDPNEKYLISKQINDLFASNRCNPLKNIISPLIMTPMFLSVFMCVERTIVFTPSCHSGGMSWFTDLAMTDITWLLPVISAMTWIGTVKIGTDRIRTPMARYFENFLSYLSIAMIPVTSTMPQGVFIYWISSNLYSLIQMGIMRNGRVRKLLGIPPSAVPNPANE
jgi:YidC/Oxa1 family membrane protein insertase